MVKNNKNKKSQNVPVVYEEPDFGNLSISSAGDKKLRAQKEKEQKEKEQENERLKKEKLEAGKKKKNKSSKKSKSQTKEERFINKESDESDEQNDDFQTENVDTTYLQKNDETVPIDDSWNLSPSESWKPSPADSWKPSPADSSNKKKENRLPLKRNESGPTHNDSGKWRKRESENNDRFNKERSPFNNSFGKNTDFNYSFNDGKKDTNFQEFYNILKRREKIFAGKVKEVKGDLFDAPQDYSLAHCVAEDFSMGAGIAKEFRAKFKRVTKLLDQNQKTGGLAILEDDNRYIYYLVTKGVSRGKPTLYTLWMSLLKLKKHMIEQNVTKLAIPQIGCGLDRLNWNEVKQMLEFVFQNTDVEINVYILDFNAEETQTPSKIQRKCFVNHKVLPLVDIDSQTGLIYFGTEVGDVTFEMECLAEKFDFLRDYKTSKKAIGDVIKTVVRNEYLYGLIIKRSKTDQISFGDFDRCLFNLRKALKADKTEYIALQGFIEPDDVVIVDKLVNLMQYILQDVEIWVCWPQSLAKYCPLPKQY